MILRQIDAAIFRGRARSLRKSAKDYDRPQDDAMAAVYECEISTLIALRETAEQMVEEINSVQASIKAIAGVMRLSVEMLRLTGMDR